MCKGYTRQRDFRFEIADFRLRIAYFKKAGRRQLAAGRGQRKKGILLWERLSAAIRSISSIYRSLLAAYRLLFDSLIFDLQVVDTRYRDAVRVQTLRENRFARS